MKFKAIIFDMDGTIIDTECIWQKANLYLLEKHSITLSDSDFKRIQEYMYGLSMIDCCTYLKLEFNLEGSLEHILQEKNIIARSLFEKEVRFIEGFTTFYEQVRSNKLKSAIATNANETTIETTNNALNLKQYFGSHIYGIARVSQGKPDPAIYYYAAEQLNVEPKDCIVFEDSRHGIEAAKKAGMYCIGINTAKKPEYLINADFTINHYNEIDLATILEKN